MTRASIKKYFVTGLFTVVPLYISFYILSVIVNFMDSFIYMLPHPINPATYLPFHIPGLGIVFTVFGIFIVGVLSANFFGKKLIKLGEGILAKVPLVSSIYKGTKQFLETFFSKDSEGFKQVVLVEFPRKGLYSIGFVTSRAKGEIQIKTKEETINVFIPTTPNPTTGFYVAAPEADVVFLDMTVEEAFKTIMTAGLVVPDRTSTIKKTP